MRAHPGEIDPRVTRFVLTPLAWVVGLSFVLPIVWMVINSLRPSGEIVTASYSLSLDTLIPTDWTLENYTGLLHSPFAPAIRNSFVVATATVVIGVLFASCAAFALSAVHWPGRNVVFAAIVICLIVPVDAVSIPLSLLMRRWGLANSYIGLVAPWVADGTAIILLRQFFLGIPRELVDAARVDGASWWTIYRRVYMPLSKPAVVGAALIMFMFEWEAYLWPVLIITRDAMDVAPLALVKIVMGRFYTDWGQMFAGAVILAGIPALILLPLQRLFTQSIASTGIKK